MTKQIIAIGGGGFGRNPGKGIIEKYILNQSEAKNQIFASSLQQQGTMKGTKRTSTQPSQN